MKKLLLLFLMLFTFSGFAQDKQFIKNYNSAILINADGSNSDWQVLDTRLIFNYGGDNTKIKMYANSKVFNFTRIGETTKGTTPGGMKHYNLKLMDDETGETVLLQMFVDEKYGCRFVDNNGDMLQLSN